LHDGATATDGASATDATSGSDASDGSVAADAGDGSVSDASNPADGATDAATDGPICSSITNAAPAVTTEVADSSTPPTGTGGTIVSGTYYVTKVTSYGGAAQCAGLTVSGETVVTAQGTSGSSLGVITYNIPGFGSATQTTSASYTTSGSTVTFTSTCPTSDAGISQPSYTATSTTLTLIEPAVLSQCGTAVEVLTKQ
jgi:hypothetical protein